ncbi:hypothetical protein [Chitinimonas koreensis]|uniref:hypothetical protein n=1 Tax=Chitinimonas koreensis TaxID=356302 RepID=UPI000420C040|nr:hypothetical protein [Chitinimonas koreensis]
MSYRLHLPIVAAPLLDLILGHPGLSDARCLDSAFPTQGRWPEGESRWYQASGVRAVHVLRDHTGFTVTIAEASAPPDYRLALALVDALADASGRDVLLPSGETVGRVALAAGHDEAWIRDHALESLRGWVREWSRERGLLRFEAACATVPLGPRLLGPMLADGKTFTRRFFELLRRCNAQAAEIEALRAPRAELKLEGRDWTVTEYREGRECVLPVDLDYVVLASADRLNQPPLLLPVAQLEALCAGRGEWVSELELRLPALGPGDWAMLLAHAATLGARRILDQRPPLIDRRYQLPAARLLPHPNLVWATRIVTVRPRFFTASAFAAG